MLDELRAAGELTREPGEGRYVLAEKKKA